MQVYDDIADAIEARIAQDFTELFWIDDARCSTDRGIEGDVHIDVTEDEIDVIALVYDLTPPQETINLPANEALGCDLNELAIPFMIRFTVVAVEDVPESVGCGGDDTLVKIKAILEAR